MSESRFPTLLEHHLSRRTLVGAAAGLTLAGAARVPFAMARQDADYPELVLVATEYAFDMPATAPGGMTRITLDNQGEMDHHAIFLKLNDGVTADQVGTALQDPTFAAIFEVAASIGGPMAGPGLAASVVLDLVPGNYTVICAIPNDEGVPHFALGMMASLEVTEAESTMEAPTPALTIELMEMMFHGLEETPPAAGPQAWDVTNAGTQLHEMGVLQLAPGVTFDQFVAMMTAPAEASPVVDESTPMAEMAMAGPPFTMIGGVAPMSPGFTNYPEFDLAAGEYALICFVPDPETGAPHFALGMMAGFTVA